MNKIERVDPSYVARNRLSALSLCTTRVSTPEGAVCTDQPEYFDTYDLDSSR